MAPSIFATAFRLHCVIGCSRSRDGQRTAPRLRAEPRIEFAYDTDSKQSANTRVRVLEMLAANRIPLIAYHFLWPGIGHVAKNGDGFRFHSAPMEMMQLKG